MRRLILAVLIISAVSLVACAPASAPEPTPEPTPAPEPEPVAEPTPEPTPPPAQPLKPEESPENIRWIASQLRDLHHTMSNLVTKYPIVTWEDYLIHEFIFGRGNWMMISRVPAVNVSDAKTHIKNAYYLTNEGKLPDETKPRDVTTGEITLEVNQAMTLLEQQVSYSYSWQESDIKWARESTNPEINTESTFLDIIEFYDEHREELTKVITKLELILSRLPKGDIAFSLE